MRRELRRQLWTVVAIVGTGAVLGSCGLLRVVDLRSEAREAHRLQRMYERMLRNQIERLERDVASLPPEYAAQLRPQIGMLRRSMETSDDGDRDTRGW